MPESLSLNGTNLSTLVRNVEDLAGLITTPVRRGENAVIPGRHGTLVKVNRIYDVGTFVLPFWIVGSDSVTGVDLVGDPAVTSFYARVDELLALLHASTLTFDHTLPDGSVRRAVAELADEPMNFTRQLGSPLFGRVAVALTIPSGFWVETTTTSQTVSGATGATLSFTSFAGATAPMDELTVTFGQSNNPKITGSTGISLAYNAVIGSGQSIAFNSSNWSYTGTGLTPDFSKIVHLGSARWFELLPGSPPTAVFTHTGGGSASVTLAGSKKYLTG